MLENFSIHQELSTKTSHGRLTDFDEQSHKLWCHNDIIVLFDTSKPNEWGQKYLGTLNKAVKLPYSSAAFKRGLTIGFITVLDKS